MRGKGRTLASVLAEALAQRPGAERAALAAALAEACGERLAREVSLRAVAPDGKLLVVASSRAWADQVIALAPRVLARINARLGRGAATALDVRVGPHPR